jgi:DNA polymerase-3 subunit gamma/tau
VTERTVLPVSEDNSPKPLTKPEKSRPTEPPAPKATPTDAQVSARPEEVGKTGEDRRKIRRRWDAFLKYIQERQRWMAAALQAATSVQREGDTLIVHFNHPAECSLLKQREHIKTLTELALDFFQENLRLHFEVAGSNACDIDPVNGLAPQQERRALANDLLVLTALDVFTGQIGDIRTGSRHRKIVSADSGMDADSEHPED